MKYPQEVLQERVTILKTVSIFSQSDEEALAKIAATVSDVWCGPNENIFQKGEAGSSMYIIVDGQVKVHDGDYVFATLGNRQVFGEYSLLDTEARSASVTTITSTQLLRLDQADLYDIMATQVNVTKGILKEFIKRMRFQNNLEERLALSNKEIQQQRDEIANKSALLEKKNRDITSSITYAKRIQNAVLPSPLKIHNIFPESFIFFKPRDIVSGDFYWYHQIDEYRSIVAAADCTGHGVPGAFMSIAGNAYLNQIVVFQGITSPDKVLDELHNTIKTNLKQEETENKDGMDITICLVDRQKKILEFAGAKNPLIYIQDNQLHYVKGDRMPIGGHQRDEDQVFTKHTISIDRPTVFYLFSDGYQDQFGGSQNKKFMTKRLRELLFDLHTCPMDEQHNKLEQTLDQWMEGVDQIDDVLVIGVKISA
jgi:serine phosphatase RsbU (regulator of sigma subunit)